MEMSVQYTISSAEGAKPNQSSDSESIVSSVEDINNWSFISDPDMQNDVQPLESESIECCRESFSSDSISVISEGEDLRLESSDSVQTNSSIELVNHTQEHVENNETAVISETATAKKSIIWTTPLVLGVVLATNAAIFYGHSRIYQNMITEFKALQENRITELLNNTAKNLKCITELEIENGRLREEIKRLKKIDDASELEKRIHRTVLEFLSQQKSTADEAPIQFTQFKTVLDHKTPPDVDASFRHDEIDEKAPKISQDKLRTLPKICYNKYAIQDALFSEDCNFGKHKRSEESESELFEDNSEYDQPYDNSKRKLLPTFCYNQRVTQDALFAEECDFGETPEKPPHAKRMKFKKVPAEGNHHHHGRRRHGRKGSGATSSALPSRRN
ncbi:uncharacterized protein LOC128743140 [Sabethes cyaneus]|uniref:uncharacterized protein LOC128743140 n=1 Tax=Sabethes cyaneus TaxID=53552 RepID=UPI00237DB20C|nr:uncharacterized protein LOC128743140 [Sabethes cyaneus]XP_053695640.1 uncharacterized protein LOC128743140 [Sabethes cyaneus]